MVTTTQYALTELAWAPPNLAGLVTATITDPSAGVQVVAATTGSMQNPGAATAWFTPQLPGTYQVAWASTGGQAGATTVTATAAVVTQLMSLNDCYDSLKLDRSLQGTNASRDADMLFYARAAAGVVEDLIGPIAPTTLTEVFDGGGTVLPLKVKPTGVVSVMQNGVPAVGWVPDFTAAVLYASWTGIPWLPGVRNIVVVYTAGTGLVKPNVLLGIREVFRQVWERSRALGGGASSDMVMQGFAIPSAVRELIGAESILPGFA